jgi:TIR domain
MTRLWQLLLDWVFRRDVFVSHSSVDKADVEWLRQELERMGYAPNKPRPGHDFRERIKTQIKTSTGAVLVETPDSRVSKEVGDEFYQIVHHRIPLVPVLRRGESVRPEAARLDWVDLVGVDLYSEQDRARRRQKLDEIDKALRGSAIDWLVARSLKLRTILLLAISVVFGVASIKALSARAFVHDVRDYVADIQSYVLQAESRLPTLPQPTDEGVRLNGSWDYLPAGANRPLATDTWERGRLRSREFFRDGLLVAADSYRFVDRTPVERVRTYFVAGADITFVDRFSSDGSLTQRLQVIPGTRAGNATAALTFRSPLPPPWMLFYR